jgi:hypothetical protein
MGMLRINVNVRVQPKLSVPADGHNPNPEPPVSWTWPSAIGQFMLNLGTLEYLVFVFLKDRLQEEAFEKTRNLHLKDRLRVIAKYLSNEQSPGEIQDDFARLVERLDPIRELRNHIAHGHLYATIDEENQKSVVTIFKAKDLDTGFLPGSRHVSGPELLAALSELDELTREFERLAGFQLNDGGLHDGPDGSIDGTMSVRESIHPAYLETHFRQEECCSDWPEEFVIITAFAITGEGWTEEQNDSADKDLEADLRRTGRWMRRLTGYSPTTGHAEAGWAVEMPLGEACDVGLRFKQDAIYYISGDELSVTRCNHQRGLIPIGGFRERVAVTPPLEST